MSTVQNSSQAVEFVNMFGKKVLMNGVFFVSLSVCVQNCQRLNLQVRFVISN